MFIGLVNYTAPSPDAQTFNLNLTCLTFQKENKFLVDYYQSAFLFRLAITNFENISTSNSCTQHNRLTSILVAFRATDVFISDQ